MNKLFNIIDKLKLLFFGYKLNKMSKKSKLNTYINIVYNVHNSLPETNNGYAMRTHFISKAIKSQDFNLFVVTRAAFPLDFNSLKKFHTDVEMYEVENIKYYRLKKNVFFLGKVPISKYLDRYGSSLVKFAQSKEASIIHSASNYINGLTCVNAANKLGIPSIYEVRGFWEITRASREVEFEKSINFKLQKRLEIQACQEATNVIALSEIVKEELIERGIEKEKIFVIPNGVNTEDLRPLEKNLELIKNLNFINKFVIGFIGSVVDYEGLTLLVKAAVILDKKYKDKFRFLIIGDGNDLENLKTLVIQLKVEHLFTFTGRIPYENIKNYYSVIDVTCYPRLDWPVCRIVSPKKPFESMAYGKPIISSSVRANSYFIEDGVNGLIHEKENVESLVKNIIILYEDNVLYNTISTNARNWVANNRSMIKTSQLIKKVYEETIEKFYKER